MGERVNPDMIVLAREACRMSQRELSEASQITLPKMSKYENGLLPVPDAELERIAIATGYKPSLFRCQDKIVGLGSSMLFNRKRETTPVGVQREIQAKVNITRFQLLRLLRSAQLESPLKLIRIDPDECGGSATAVARRVRAMWNVPMGPIQNITNIIESAGGLIVLCDFGTDQIDGAHLWISGAPPMFFMNANAPGDRHRFNLAHELGHAVMHEYPTGDIEAQANEFAREFLLPADELSLELDESLTVEKLAKLKQRWKVSMAAILYAAHAIGRVSDYRYRSLYAYFSSLGYRRNEPIEINREEPTLVRQLLDVHRDGLGYTDADLRELMMANEPDFLRLPDTFKMTPRPLRIEGGPLSIQAFRERKTL